MLVCPQLLRREAMEEDGRRTFKSPEEELDEALKALECTEILTRKNRKMLPDREESPLS
jgi:hypothetical protein